MEGGRGWRVLRVEGGGGGWLEGGGAGWSDLRVERGGAGWRVGWGGVEGVFEGMSLGIG